MLISSLTNIGAPNGSGDYYSEPGHILASYEVEIAQEGDYVLWGRVIAPSGYDDSFWIQIDDGPDNLWEVAGGSNWHWDEVSNRGGADPEIFNLTAGTHIIKVKVREDGTEIDKLFLTNDVDFVPSEEGEPAENCATECIVNEDCGTDNYINENYCYDDDVYRDYRTYTCNNPGMQDAYCSHEDTANIQEDCPFGCENGACLPSKKRGKKRA